ncbi:acetyl-CoA carboxylase biotin carboxylase subunit [Bosea caraganae]|uniref:Acetyl-CoA carboxylase biotin carboxylase subunit n=1 Tax=Bosea caraganae TaxID=2763117 RepID=A0A370LC98_9HYPH|nr:acetyl-CoA carboxylase biotin carboxylase subunit [Bosea caraganae]RDJ27577.1 acetyl-CoA carboxylase biotin carboxylase subunit [Bosea caraganae]RDJ29592.1 acetyl-CoA carboxylase biotin carboxylase subunit [Bosea caraganae]
MSIAKKLPSILIANRGEIACRVIRTAKRLGLRTIAVYSEADAEALFVEMADEAYLIGPAPARESYLDADKILAVAKQSGAACIHPGYGFLSENAGFADACAAAGIVFVGPPASAIRAMGLKDAAKALVEKARVPVVPGYHGAEQDVTFLAREAERIGYPVLIKAVAGGGGKGMKKVDRPEDFADALSSAQREGKSAFGDARVLVEKYVLSPRHVEIQVFGDSHGNVVHLYERDCSLQRRHQKVIEEAPAPGMTAEVRAAMGKAATEAAKAVGYVGAGTVEFIADGREGLRADRFYFMEMNTRLQVEHPVTEAITGLDLVELQLKVAAGEPLGFTQADVTATGHAVEARLYAEDPEKGFLPSTGKLWALQFPAGEGIRVDTGVEAGDTVTPYYDPMIAKIIAHGATRNEALDRLAQALGETVVAGPRSNLAFLKKLAEAEGFRTGPFDTGFIERNLAALGAVPQPLDAAAVAAAALQLEEDRQEIGVIAAAERVDGESRSPWLVADAFSLLPRLPLGLPLLVDGEKVEARIEWHEEGARVSLPGHEIDEGEHEISLVQAEAGTWLALHRGRQTAVSLYDPFAVDLDAAGGSGGVVKAPMHGKLIALFVQPGELVTKGQRLAIVEAMKMEHVLTAPRDGTVSEVVGTPGGQVAEGAKVVVLGE